ncbi:MAG: DUF1841 family protein [Gammaproteobacteria bacterium]
MLPSDRGGFRRMFAEAWRKRRARLPADPLETQIGDVVGDHPEYQPLLEAGETALESEWAPEDGQANPFMHMGLHLSIREQVATDRPAGIAAQYRRLAGILGQHEAEHRMMDVLGEALWRAQRNNQPPDEVSYLEAIKGIPGRRNF